MRCFAFCFLFLANCGAPGPFEFAKSDAQCLGPWKAPGGRAFKADALIQNEVLLRAMFAQAGLETHARGFCDRFGGIPIRVIDAVDFPCDIGGPMTCLGASTLTEGITLERTGGSLMHELLHYYETENLVLDTYDHPRWAEKGFNALTDSYEAQAQKHLW